MSSRKTKQWPDFDASEYLDDITKINLEKVREKKLKKDFDYILVIAQKDIGNRMGKSQLGMITCSFMDESFNLRRMFFNERGYWKVKTGLKRMSALDFDEGVNVFWSRESGVREKRQIFKEFLINPSNNFFTVIIIPNLALLQKDFKNIKVNCIWVIDRRGRFKCYSRKTGKIGLIRIDPLTKKVTYPSADFVGYWKDISKTDGWKQYLGIKKKYLSGTNLNTYVVKRMEKTEKMLEDSYTMRDLAKICNVSRTTIHRWINNFKIFRKRDFVIDYSGRKRVKRTALEPALKRLEKKRKGRK